MNDTRNAVEELNLEKVRPTISALRLDLCGRIVPYRPHPTSFLDALIHRTGLMVRHHHAVPPAGVGTVCVSVRRGITWLGRGEDARGLPIEYRNSTNPIWERGMDTRWDQLCV